MTTPLATTVAGLAFRNPVLLAAGTAAFGREIDEVINLDRIGGLVTKAVSVAPRDGNAAPRATDAGPGMLNAIGLANPGVAGVRATELPWLATHRGDLRVLVNVVGKRIEEFAEVVAGLDDSAAIDGYEINVSCPNTEQGGLEFGADPVALASVVRGVRATTRKPIAVKLSPSLADIGAAARIAVDAGADVISVINTMPGLVVDVASRRPVLGFGSGGVSGPGLRAIGVLAVRKVRLAVAVPIIGIGGVVTAEDALQYLIAGASLVAVGTAALADPRQPERIVRGLEAWCASERVDAIGSLVGTLEWPS
ncbi:MAG: dihydroorotate dehydrogenase [Gemmatimonadaceae bacterium]|nr:dihydroorotate dehydrogenase [Gemmatimonadaceae bacterium]